MNGLKSATMLYRKGTEERIHGVHVDKIIVDEHEVPDYLEQGWYLTPTAMKQAAEAEAEAARIVVEAEAAKAAGKQKQAAGGDKQPA
ncbi:hypothetical protein B0G76_2847 [Paraburkholderia sp. BL23I1N1]|uniref:hypothetical protein n=1 Tax=Paraburkholderia sp. BL23I1N1 TaxID=1938802 RepID=UPI000E73D951|nr:hypothetical protein [Paraburkholderia sp. BL23I1N1]RKE36645.1 hypothetical protein B0G76_2847 [Paraburkholderia sp. BL23I1N1]